MVSIITATYNSSDYIFNLIESLRSQSDMNFEWVVVDGKSSDNTVQIIKSVKGVNINLICEPDKGIYDAINKGIKLSKYKYYIVCGSDDALSLNAIENFNRLIKSNPDIDIFAFSFLMNGKIHKPLKHLGFLYGMRGNSSCHSVGLLINKNLHDSFGLYSLNHSILADQYFIQRCILSNCNVLRVSKIVSGEYSTDGISSQTTPGILFSFLEMQLVFYKFKPFQYCLYYLRLVKYHLNKFLFYS